MNVVTDVFQFFARSLPKNENNPLHRIMESELLSHFFMSITETNIYHNATYIQKCFIFPSFSKMVRVCFVKGVEFSVNVIISAEPKCRLLFKHDITATISIRDISMFKKGARSFSLLKPKEMTRLEQERNSKN